MERTAGSADCPLCGADHLRALAVLGGRRYLDCSVCGMVHLAPEHRLPSSLERAHYGTHENDPADPAYRQFLGRLAAPLVARLQPGAEGLDYGSGPGPALAVMLEEQGFSMRVYDPFFAPDLKVLSGSYDFITCTETAEHFFSPRAELDRLQALLRNGGWLGIMTGVLRPERPFEQWHYPRDPTHVSFYRPRTLEWIAGHYGWFAEVPHPNVVLFRKPESR